MSKMSSGARKSRSEKEREKVIQDRLQVLLIRMLQDEDNKYCADCDAKGPRWASWNIGIFVCIRCAGIHRNLGVHISKVKSVNLDSWTPQQVASMQIMGNSRSRAVYEAQVPEGFRRPQSDSQLETFIRAKYEKKKYIAREYVATPAPEFPDGWTALIEAEKQKKDIRTIVLPSHSSQNNASEEKSTKEQQVSRPVTTKNETKPVESAFDLLSLNNQSSGETKPQPQQPQTQPPKPAAATSAFSNDLLCLSVGAPSSDLNDFDDFVGPRAVSTNQQTTSDNNDNASNKSQAMTKDSIMALFQQAPPSRPNMNLPNSFSMANNASLQGMQIPANFGLATTSHQQIGLGGSNPFLNMANNQAANGDQNNLFGSNVGGRTDFLQ